jgi:diguanylate cyclase (GGDEF)-like protein
MGVPLSDPAPPSSGLTPIRRLNQILGACLVVLAVGAGTSLATHNLASFFMVLGAILLLGVALGLARAKRSRAAATLTLITITALASLVLWHDQGTMDPAILCYPGILVFAAILGGPRIYLLLLGGMIANIGLLVLGSVSGWHVIAARPVSLVTFVNLSFILLGVSFGVWMMARDQQRTLTQLRSDNERLAQSQAHIDFLANFDPLTGLPNRTLGRERLIQAVSHAKRRGQRAALIHLDMDNFKSINDSMGHMVGDKLIMDIGSRIAQALRPMDTLCRQGGDEFFVVLGELASSEDAAGVAGRILATLGGHFRIQDLEIPVTASLGIAMYPEDGADFETLMQKADTAMYQAKNSGRNGIRFFDPAMNTNVMEHLRLVSDMRQALEQGQFVLHYQPQIRLDNGQVVGAEALIRWQHPELGLLPPQVFIPVAEKSGQIIEIGRWVVAEACRQARIWLDQGIRIVMAVNLSPIQFRQKDLEVAIHFALEQAGLPAALLELELTESMLLDDSPALTEKLANLKALGLSLSIDDFGTGYSNLGYLQRFEVERLKIDQSFVRRLSQNPQNQAIVQAIIQMSKSLGLGTVAEGIEDEAVLARLQELGCDIGQGFLWAKALAPEAFVAFVRGR